jgi:hypothetical protein
MSWSYDNFNLSDDVTYLIDPDSDNFNPPAFELVASRYATKAGAVLLTRPPAVGTVSLSGYIIGNVNTGAWGTARDALVAALSRPGRRLRANFTGDRFAIATPHNIRTRAEGINWGTWSADFVISDPYFQAATPSADVRTLTGTELLASDQTLVRFALNPGGTAPSPPIIYVRSSSVAPSRWVLSNLTTKESINTEAAVGSGAVLALDPQGYSAVMVSPMTNVLGWWPLWDAASPALNMAGSDRYLSETGTPLWRQDAPWPSGIGVVLDGTAYLSHGAAEFALGSTFTAALWVIPAVANTDMGILGKAGASDTGYRVRRTAANVFEASVGSGSATRTATGTRTAVVGEPYHVAVTLTGGTLTLYVNGEVEAVTGGGAFTVSAASNAFSVGAAHNISGTLEYWNGTIGDLVLTTDAWTQAQVRSAMRWGVPAVHGTPAVAPGQWPLYLDPAAGATNLIEIRADIDVMDLGGRVFTAWRSRFG